MLPPLEELFVFALLLIGVVGVYYALKLHYIFAFALVKNTSVSNDKKQKIEKIKTYVFLFLKILLAIGFVGMFLFGTSYLMDGESLKTLVVALWGKISEGFWVDLVFTLLRIALLIVISRYLLKKTYRFLDTQQQKTINKKVYNEVNVKKVYLRLHNTIKYTVVLAIIYRITHFFSFLEEVSAVLWIAVVTFFVMALAVTIREIMIMRGTHVK